MVQGKSKSLVELRGIAEKTLAQIYNSTQSLEQSFLEEITRNTKATLPEFERAWIYDICSGVLRYRGRLDFLIDTYSLKKKPTGALRRLLQIGVFQLIAQAQDVPPALAVSETVQSIRNQEGEAPSKFANALLRKIADSREQWQQWKITASAPFEEQLAWCSLPEWLFKKLRKERGSDWVFAFSEANLLRPKTWYRDLEAQKSYPLENGYRGDEPRGYVQDISNQKVVEAAVALLKNKKAKILDLCSAPGGKTLGLAVAGYSVTATDIDEDRLLKVKENSARLQLKDLITIVPHARIWNSEAPYNFLWDAVWIDAPCSSTGIIRRHPEIKWNRDEKDVQRMVFKQQELVKWAVDHLAPNGLLIYSTCSVLREENTISDPRLKPLQTLSFFPQDLPHGDGIIASVLELSVSPVSN